MKTTISTSCNTAQKKQKGARNKMTLDVDLEKEIRKAENRLYYLRNRKKTGFPGGRVTKNPKVRGIKKEDKEFLFYNDEIKTKHYLSKYKTYQEAAIQAGKMFTAYHTNCYNAINKFGTEEEKNNLSSLFTVEIKTEVK